MRTRALTVAVIAILGLCASAAASASTVVYQCGPGVCAVNPAARHPAVKRLVASARLAGVTRDGRTASWVNASGNLVLVPLRNGTSPGRARVIYRKGVGSEPQLSPDGRHVLWWYTAPFGAFGTGIYVNELTVGQSEPFGVSGCACVTTHGWINGTPIAAFPRGTTGDDSPSELCALRHGGSNSCARRIAEDARGSMWFPAGSPRGDTIAVAVSIGSDDQASGRIELFSSRSGSHIRDLTTGRHDTTPQFSPDGRSIVFERRGTIVTHSLRTGAERVVGHGVYPFWGRAGGA